MFVEWIARGFDTIKDLASIEKKSLPNNSKVLIHRIRHAESALKTSYSLIMGLYAVPSKNKSSNDTAS
ncbi:hypothetical protein KO02_00540 [Sphingobacterium sp. ML3W]|nr:hypothetical protein KO02_00540 [Sphingobacterium sp. ML3W]